MRNLFPKTVLALVVAVVLVPTLGAAAAAPTYGPLDAPVAETTLLGTLGAELDAHTYQTTTVGALDTQSIMESVNEGVSYGFSFAGAFSPLITIIIGFSVAGAVIGLLFALGPRVSKMIKNAL